MKNYLLYGLLTIILIGVFMFLTRSPKSNSLVPPSSNITLENGTQIITINARGGYSPKITQAQANVPSQLHLSTNSSYDCSTAVVIPSLNYHANLPPSGITTLNLPPQSPGSSLKGLCAMGMYSFTINFN